MDGWMDGWMDPSRGEFFRSVLTGPEDHPVSYTRLAGCFHEVKQSDLGADHQPLSSAEVANRLRLCLRHPSVSAQASRGVTLIIIIIIIIIIRV